MKSHLLIPLLLLLFLSCTKQKKNESTEPQLPPLTQTGAGTFGCKVNGKIISIYSGGTMFGGPNPKFTITVTPAEQEKLNIFASKLDSPRYDFNFHTPFNLTVGICQTTGIYPFNSYFFDYSGGSTIPGNSNSYRTDSVHILTLNITYYNTNILSGTFEGEMVNDNGDVMTLTEGRFDLGN